MCWRVFLFLSIEVASGLMLIYHTSSIFHSLCHFCCQVLFSARWTQHYRSLCCLYEALTRSFNIASNKSNGASRCQLQSEILVISILLLYLEKPMGGLTQAAGWNAADPAGWGADQPWAWAHCYIPTWGKWACTLGSIVFASRTWSRPSL